MIVFKDASEQNLNDLLKFMYRGEVEVDESNLSDFLKFADTLQVKGLSHGEGLKEEDDEDIAERSPPPANPDYRQIAINDDNEQMEMDMNKNRKGQGAGRRKPQGRGSRLERMIGRSTHSLQSNSKLGPIHVSALHNPSLFQRPKTRSCLSIQKARTTVNPPFRVPSVPRGFV